MPPTTLRGDDHLGAGDFAFAQDTDVEGVAVAIPAPGERRATRWPAKGPGDETVEGGR